MTGAATSNPQDARPTVAVVGGGASGTLTAAQLCLQAAAQGRPLDVIVIDPAELGRGVAYATHDPRHRLNVPASGMSALPEDASHFVRWMRRHVDATFDEFGFAPRMYYGEYLEQVLGDAANAARGVHVEIRRTTASDLRRHGRRWRMALGDGSLVVCDAVVLAVGAGRPSVQWAPAALQHSPRFVANPWGPRHPLAAPGSRPGSVVLVGASLTMADMAMVWGRAGTTMHVVSRHGLAPLAHVSPPPARITPRIDHAPTTLTELRRLVLDHVRSVTSTGGDWRSAVDGLRPLTAQLWDALPEAERADFLAVAARRWNQARHRVEPSIAAWLDDRVTEGSLQWHTGTVVAAKDTDDAVHLHLSSGQTLAATAVLNCTGPCNDVTLTEDPLLMNLLAAGVLRPGPLNLGVECEADGRVVASTMTRPPVWAIGAMRLGQLWETTAIPEIRAQACSVATAVLDALPSVSVTRRPRDVYGLPLSASPDAACAYREGMGRILRVQSGAEDLLVEAVELDESFALGHATLALLGLEWGAAVDVEAALQAAHRNADRADERERRFIEAVTARVRTPGRASASQLIGYVHDYPEDALAVSISVPTIAFGGATEVPAEAWTLVEGLAPVYRDDWWYRGLLAFVRQEQGRYAEAAHLADLALAVEPGSGHAVHARTHAYYEKGEHAAGLSWLDRWIATCGRQASHRAHFSWHAALHELALGDDAAVMRRFHSQLGPSAVHGVRALIDSAALLWRCHVAGCGPDLDTAWTAEAITDVLRVVPADLLHTPSTPFMGMHAALALAAAGDCQGLHRLRRHARRQSEPVFTQTLVDLVDALTDYVHGEEQDAAQTLLRIQDIDRLGGSAAQREVIEETLLHVAGLADRADVAQRILQSRLARRPGPRDSSRLGALAAAVPPVRAGARTPH